MVREISGGIHFSYTRQNEALGLGHAVLTARELVGDEPFAVLLGDVIMESAVPATRALIEIYEETGKGAITVQEVPPKELQFYGVIAASPGNLPRWGESVLKLNDSGRKTEARTSSFQSRRFRPLRPASRKFSIISTKQNPAPAAKFSLPTACAPWRQMKDCGRTSTPAKLTTRETRWDS